MPSGIQDVLSDPEFGKLSAGDQKAVLGKFDPDFAQLAPEDQDKAMTALMRQYGQQEQPGAFTRFVLGAGQALGLPTKPEEIPTWAMGNAMRVMAPGSMAAQDARSALEATKQSLAKAKQDIQDPNLPFAVRATGALGHTVAGVLSPLGGQVLEQAGGKFGTGDIAGGLGATTVAVAPFLAGGLMPKGAKPALADTVKPTHTEALGSLLESHGGATDPHALAQNALPAIRNQAALDRLDLSPGSQLSLKGGRAIGKAVIDTTNNAIKAHQGEVAEISKPYSSTLVDQTPIAQAYLDKITPELRRNEPGIAKGLETEAAKYAQIKDGRVIGPKPAPLADVNSLRIRLNQETAAAQAKPEGGWRKSDLETKADLAAVKAARDVQYGTLAKMSGIDESYIRSLQSKEGALMETRDSLVKAYNKASAAQAEAVSRTLREKVAGTYPTSHGIGKKLGSEFIAPKPIEAFNARLQTALSDLGEGKPTPSYGPQSTASTTVNGQITQAHVAQENAFFNQAKQELGSSAPLSDVLKRAQQLKLNQPPGQLRQIQPPPKPPGNRVQLPPGRLSPLAIMLMAKQGTLTPQEADSQLQRTTGKTGKTNRLKD